MKNWLTWNKETANPMMSFQKEMNQLFNRFFDEPFAGLGTLQDTFTPKVNVVENEKSFQVTAELPGMEEKDVEVNLEDNVLSIKGEKKKSSEEKNQNWHRTESSYGYFQRIIPLPKEVVADKVEATFKNGLLSVSLPKNAGAKPQGKKINVKNS